MKMAGFRMGSVKGQSSDEQDFGLTQARLWILYRNRVEFHSSVRCTDSQVARPHSTYIASCSVYSAILGGSQDAAGGLDLHAGRSFYYLEHFFAFDRARVGLLIIVMSFTLLEERQIHAVLDRPKPCCSRRCWRAKFLEEQQTILWDCDAIPTIWFSFNFFFSFLFLFLLKYIYYYLFNLKTR